MLNANFVSFGLPRSLYQLQPLHYYELPSILQNISNDTTVIEACLTDVLRTLIL